MTTYVIEISNLRYSDGKPYERKEVEAGALAFVLCCELGRSLTKAEQLFLARGAQVKHEDQRTGRTVTAYRKGAVPPTRPKDFTEQATATSKGGRS